MKLHVPLQAEIRICMIIRICLFFNFLNDFSQRIKNLPKIVAHFKEKFQKIWFQFHSVQNFNSMR